jgi:hypothetical protein
VADNNARRRAPAAGDKLRDHIGRSVLTAYRLGRFPKLGRHSDFDIEHREQYPCATKQSLSRNRFRINLCKL